MRTTRHLHAEAELVHWMFLVLAALALLLAIATALGAGNPVSEPRPLPTDLIALARPLATELSPPFFPEFPPGRTLPPAAAVARLWTTLDSLHAGCFTDALGGFELIRFPAATAHWREIGLGATHLLGGDLEGAEFHLSMARQMAPQHSVTAYYLGLLRLEQAAALRRVPDPGNRVGSRLVAYRPRSEDAVELQRQAVFELRQALAWAGEIRLDEPLLDLDPRFAEAVVVPRVSDLLVSLGADNFVGKAHHLLFGLELDRGALFAAEFHLDQAAESGVAVLYGYCDLAQAYAEGGHGAAVLRVTLKDLDAQHPWVRRLAQQLTAVWQPN